MCLLVVAFGVSDDYPLVVAGNRDEFHARPTQSARRWSDHPDIIGGRDLQAGGSWLALHQKGRFATVTNFRDAQQESGKLRSRGHLITDFLNSDLAPLDFMQRVDGDAYAGFNLLLSDGDSLAYVSNRGVAATQLPAGVYGLSNATLDTPWSKVERSKRGMQALLTERNLNAPALFRLLDDRDRGPADEVEKGRLPFTTAHALSAPFIVLEDYGTRSSSVVLCDQSGHWSLTERRFDAAGKRQGETTLAFDAQE
ncbi:MAG: NRDE family protein [Woeseiaceae bacterium]